jgi:hypothetical protein
MFRFRSRRSQETAEAIAAAQEALERLAQTTEKLNAAGRRAGEALTGLADVTARLADVQGTERPAGPTKPTKEPDDSQPG